MNNTHKNHRMANRKNKKHEMSDIDFLTPQNNNNNLVIDDFIQNLKIPLKCKTQNQKKLTQLINDKEVIICAGPAGTGKAQPLDSLILTPNGYKKMGDIQIGDEVISIDGNPTKVIGVYPQGLKEIYKISFSDGTTTEASGDHLWFTQTENERQFRKRITLENGKRKKIGPRGRPGKIRTTEAIKNTLTIGIKHPKLNHTIPITSTVNFTEQKVLIDPYILGILLGDGSISSNSIKLSSNDIEIINEINNRLPEQHKVNKLGHQSYSIVSEEIKENNILTELRNYRLYRTKSEDKFIPDSYLFNNVETRLNILQGLMDTNGTVDKRTGVPIFYSTSKKLVDGVRFIVESFGGIVSISDKIGKYKKNGIDVVCKSCYAVSINLPENFNPFKLNRKKCLLRPRVKYKPNRLISNIEYVGKKEAQCIAVEDKSNLYLTNNFIVTHNTYVTCAEALTLLKERPMQYKKIIIVKSVTTLRDEEVGFIKGNLKEKMEPTIYSFINNFEKLIGKYSVEKLRENGIIEEYPIAYMRGINFDNAIIIIDEVQNITVSNARTILTRIGTDAKMIFLGDEKQIDMKNPSKSSLTFLLDKFEELYEIGTMRFINEDIVRNPLITKIELIFDKN